MEEINKIAIIEPVGGHGGMDYYDYGLAYGLGANDIVVNYHTCNKTIKREFANVFTYYTFHNLWISSKLLKSFYFLKYYYEAICHAKSQKSNLVHLHFFSFTIPNLLVLLMLKSKHLKSTVTVHDVDSFHKSSLKFIETISYKLINGVIIHNKSSHDDLLKKKIKLPKIVIIPHGNYIPFVNQLPLPTENKIINLLFFGQIKEVKGLDILLNAFSIAIKQNKNFKLIIAGRPWKTEIDKYERLIQELNISEYIETHFRYIEDAEIESFYNRSHLVVLPYKRIYQSGVLLLSISQGRTAITSDLPAFSEIITSNENGFIFKSENIEDLAQCILNLTIEEIAKTTKKSQQIIHEKYDWVKIGKQTLDFYKTL